MNTSDVTQSSSAAQQSTQGPQGPQGPRGPRKPRVPITATVTGTTTRSSQLIRVFFDCPGIVDKQLPHTDHYVKLLFTESGEPLVVSSAEELKATGSVVRRTYTLCEIDAQAGTFAIDFVSHGTHGIAGPWATRATAGDQISFLGPGGAWHPEETVKRFVLAGDESAAPAIGEALLALPDDAEALALVEVADAHGEFALPSSSARAKVEFVHRNGATHGTELVAKLREHANTVPVEGTSWFVHGVAEMVKDVRSLLFVDLKVAKQDASISGYWRLGMTEDQWQASKREFVEQAEQAESAALQEQVGN